MSKSSASDTVRRTDKFAPIASWMIASNIFIGLALVMVLYFGREIFVPLVIAVLLSFVLAPLLRLFRRCHAGRVGGVLAAVTVASVIILSLGGVLTQQIAQLAENLPRYQITISEKIHSLRGAASAPGIFSRLFGMFGSLRREISKPEAPAGTDGVGAVHSEGAQPKPVPVEIQQPPPKPLEIVKTIAGPLLAPLATAGIVIVFVIFILLFREDLRDRFIRLTGVRDLGRTSEAIDDAGDRLSRFFLAQTGINAGFGIIIGTGLWLIGIPNPVLWGIVAALMRFVPYIGAFVAAAFPVALAIAVDPGWSMLAWTVGLFLIVEPILGQFVEPLLYGHNTGLSPVAVVVAAAFWTWLWGPIGLLLSTPLTVCLAVLGRHVERLEFLDVLLGDEPALTPEQSFFQRTLAGDADEAADQAEKFMRDSSLCDFYDQIAIPGLLLARTDEQRGALDSARLAEIKQTLEGVVDDLFDHEDVVQPRTRDSKESEEAASENAAGNATPARLPVVTSVSLSPAWRGDTPILCVGARDTLDEAAAIMLAQILHKHGIGARIEPSTAVTSSNIIRLETTNLAMVCVCCLGSGSPAHIRYLIRRLRRRLPHAKLLVGLFGGKQEQGPAEQLQTETEASVYATSLRSAVELCIAARYEPENTHAPSTKHHEAAAANQQEAIP
jgi:predicted PurR-regulated permease PerM